MNKKNTENGCFQVNWLGSTIYVKLLILISITFFIKSCRNAEYIKDYMQFYKSNVVVAKAEKWSNYKKLMGASVTFYTDNKSNVSYFLVFLKTSNYLLICDTQGLIISKHFINTSSRGETFDTYIKSPDSIYACIDRNMIVLSDTNRLLKHWVFDSISAAKLQDMTICSNKYWNDFIVYNNKLCVFIIPNVTVTEFKKIYSRSTIAVFDISKNYLVLSDTFAYLPDKFRKDFYFIGFPITQPMENDKYVYCLRNTDTLYSIDLRNPTNNREIALNSRSFIENRPLNVDSFKNDPRYQSKYLMSNTSNLWFKYDKYRNVYYKLYNLPVKYNNDDGTVNNFDDAPFILSILDSNLNIIKEIEFPGKIYDKVRSVITNSGLLLRKNLDDRIEYDTYDFTY